MTKFFLTKNCWQNFFDKKLLTKFFLTKNCWQKIFDKKNFNYCKCLNLLAFPWWPWNQPQNKNLIFGEKWRIENDLETAHNLTLKIFTLFRKFLKKNSHQIRFCLFVCKVFFVLNENLRTFCELELKEARQNKARNRKFVGARIFTFVYTARFFRSRKKKILGLVLAN